MSRIAVAMSGGLDSSVAAMLLLDRGEEVLGLSLLLWTGGPGRTHGRCCAPLDLADARRVAGKLGFPHYTLDYQEVFRHNVVVPFVRDYLAGRTPSPCVRCNTFVKFDALFHQARRLGADRLATGHYARIVQGPEGFELHRAADREKDQSYYLFEVEPSYLERLEFPVGELRKAEVRDLARARGLPVAEKGESMEVCFVEGGVREFVERQAAEEGIPFAPIPARLLRPDGSELGRAEPYYRYTVGQRRGLGVAAGARQYVLRVIPERQEVVVGSERELLCRAFRGERVHWLTDPPEGPIEVEVQIRSRHVPCRAQVRPGFHGEFEVEFEVPQRAIAPGQASVFYQGSRVLGGGWIQEPLR
jgi:tRNA-specific 2-thiouridylase